MKVTIEETLDKAGTGRFQRNLLGVFGLVWAADAMQVLAVGFTGAAIAKTFGLTIGEALQTGTLFFLGMLIGAAVFGKLADRYGRRKVLLITVACDAVFGLLSAFAPSFGILLALRFLTGIAVGGTLPVDYAMMAEFLPSKNRGRWLVMLEGFWAVGTVIIALAAWAASLAGVEDAWRYIFIVTAAPALIGIWLRIWVPESPMHLLKIGRADEAKLVMNRVLRGNGKPELAPDVVIEAPQMVTTEKLLSPNLRQRTLIILAIWFLVSVSYYGIFTWIPAKLASDGFGFVRGYGFLVVVALAQIPGYALAAYGVEAWGRRKTLIAFLFISAAACALFTVATTSALVGSSILIMSFALLGTWGALYAFTPELYPTALRGSGMGAAGAMARLGGLLAPSALAIVVSQSFNMAVALFAGLLALAGLIAFFINVETRDQALT
ncbi:MFS transporter [Falsochrobactrum ovis]|uniref:Putative MFS transporter n=1 Tax=Falsochrobactrum ovis TaxID=1293442 RepID=A0A364JW76_9HYPH|nr:MFS transporter [Falsochrobactrum ovis]RAK30894.1 putative MFS transporter [Falsochrobactrum ovis]